MSSTAFGDATQHRSSKQFVAEWSPERAVLTHLLDQYPRRLTLQELASEVGDDLRASAVERAVKNLAAARFLHREGAALLAAPAVVNFDQGAMTTEF
jgi:hypothetical protein